MLKGAENGATGEPGEILLTPTGAADLVPMLYMGVANMEDKIGDVGWEGGGRRVTEMLKGDQMGISEQVQEGGRAGHGYEKI